MRLQRQIDDVVREIKVKRRELGRLLDRDDKSDSEWGQVRVLERELEAMEREVDRARRWLSSCGVSV